MAAGAEWIFGLHAVQAVLKTQPTRVREMRLLRNRNDQRLGKIRTQAESLGIPWSWATRAEMDHLVAGNHQGVAALAEVGGAIHDEHFLLSLLDRLQRPPLLLVLDGVTDPHNLGACLRTADAAGVDAVIAPKDGSVGVTATVRKVASGAADAVPFVVVTNLARTLRQLQQRGLWVVGTAGEAQGLVYQADLQGPLVLVLGAEDKGLRQLTREHCDNLVKVPMQGVVTSLNVAVAAGVCLFEAVRQRQSRHIASDTASGQ